MELRYDAVPSQVVDFCEAIRLKNFLNLDGARIMYVFDNKKSVKAGRITIAKIKKTNDEMKFLSMEENGTTYDYVLTIDRTIWDALEERDRQRVIFHELCHCEVDMEKANPYGIKDHEIQGFYDEVPYNADDERWNERIAVIADSVYDPENQAPPEETESQDEDNQGGAYIGE